MNASATGKLRVSYSAWVATSRSAPEMLPADTIRPMGSRKKPPLPQAGETPKTPGVPPRPFLEWRTNPFDRDEDAAYAFGHHLIVHCRDKAQKKLAGTTDEMARASAMNAVDEALNNVCAMLEGFSRLDIDPAHRMELALQVRVLNSAGEVVETREISPCKLDLQIGYWKWARDREFR